MSTSTTATEKVAYEKLVRATVRVNNSVDESKVYDIEADAEINNGIVGNINSGTVKKDGSQVATFNSYGNETVSYTHLTLPTNREDSYRTACFIVIVQH